jgi:transcriptional regulator with XRE-family HTH domain
MDTKKQDNTAAQEIGKRLKVLRVEQGMSAASVCEKAGIRPPTLTAIEGGRYNTGIRQITDVAKALGAHIEIVKD